MLQVMGKAARIALKAQGYLNDLGGATVDRQWLTGQVLYDDLFNPFDVVQVKGQRPAARLIAAQSAILFSQPQQRLALPDLCPREVSGQQAGHELAHMRPTPLGVVDQPFGVTQRVVRQLSGIISIVGRPMPGLLPLMGFDYLTVVVDAHQTTITTNGDLPADVPRGHRVGRLLEADMMIRMDFMLRPNRRVEALGRCRQHRWLLSLPEHN